MPGEVTGLRGIQGTQHPPGGIPPDTVRAMVMAGIEALPDHRVLLEASPDSPLPTATTATRHPVQRIGHLFRLKKNRPSAKIS
jgi:hypothetical protein